MLPPGEVLLGGSRGDAPPLSPPRQLLPDPAFALSMLRGEPRVSTEGCSQEGRNSTPRQISSVGSLQRRGAPAAGGDYHRLGLR